MDPGIGQRIRARREQKQLSRRRLAELISPTEADQLVHRIADLEENRGEDENLIRQLAPHLDLRPDHTGPVPSQSRTHVVRATAEDDRPRAPGIDCVVVIHTRDSGLVGRRFALDRPERQWIGRGDDNRIVLPSECCSRKHASLEFRDGTWWVIDNQSTNGTYVNDGPVREAALKSGDRITFGDTILKFLAGSDVEAQYAGTIASILMTDGLTQLSNRAHFEAELERLLRQCRERSEPATLAMLDVDHFKKVDESYGHVAGGCRAAGLGGSRTVGYRRRCFARSVRR